jgi:hypothetical protein
MNDKKERYLASEEWAEFDKPAPKKDNANASLAWVALGVCFVILLFNPLVGAILGAGAFLWLLSANKSAKK